jgi:hypothetical protein
MLVQARRRWTLMVKSIPSGQSMDLPDIIDALVDKHMPSLKEDGQKQGNEEELRKV